MSTSLRAFASTLVATLLVLIAFLSAADAACTKKSPYVGFKGSFSSLEHSLRGTVQVLDDCTFLVTGLNINPSAPAVYFWGSATDNIDRGFRISTTQLKGVYNGGFLRVTLGSGVTFAKFSRIAVYCEEFKANFGFVRLSKPRRALRGDRASDDLVEDFGQELEEDAEAEAEAPVDIDIDIRA